MKKTGGATSEVFCVAGKTPPEKDLKTSSINPDIPEDEDEDVQMERETVKLLAGGGQGGEVSLFLFHCLSI